MRLAVFIRSNENAIVAAWEEFAQTYLPSAAHMDRAALRDHIIGLLRFISQDLETSQTERERSEKAKGQGPKGGGANDSAAETHADLRFTGGFDTVEMVSEFRALRASVIKLWRSAWGEPDEIIPDLLRFNEAVDQVMTESLSRYTEKLNHAGALLVGTLVHDFQKPLTIVSDAARALRDGKLDDRQTQLVSQIETGTSHVDLMVSELIDAVHIRVGEGIPISLAPIDVSSAVNDAVKDVAVAHPERTVAVETADNLEGDGDYARIRQTMSILIDSAIQHGSEVSKITVKAKLENGEVVLSIHSAGTISPDIVATLFDPLTHKRGENPAQSGTTRLNLGFFIAKGIITAHGGKLTVVSDEQQGINFIAQLPQRKLAL